MLIAHVRFPVAAAHRQAVCDALKTDLETVRAMPGCVAVYPFLDLADEATLGVVHEWESETDFDAYTRSEVFRSLGLKIRPLMAGKPESRRFRSRPVDVID